MYEKCIIFSNKSEKEMLEAYRKLDFREQQRIHTTIYEVLTE